MKGNILCFGDSNTWGLCPDTWKRYPKEDRWTGIITGELKDEYYVIEEGLNGRTANETDYEEPFLNGRDYMRACALSHRPVTVLIVMLGTNDVKCRYNKNAKQIAESVAELTRDMAEVLKNSQEDSFEVILIAPRSMDERVLGDGTFDEASITKSVQLGELLKEKAVLYGWRFIDADTEAVERGCDGLHLAINGHREIARLVVDEIKSIQL